MRTAQRPPHAHDVTIAGRTFEVRRRRAIRIIVWSLLDPESVTDNERLAAARWLLESANGGERPARPFDLRREMTQRDISQRELAARVGVNPSTVHNWITRRSRPSLGAAYRVADALGLGYRRRAVALAFGTRRRRIATGLD